MKRFLLGLVIAVMMTTSVHAKSYEERNWQSEMPFWPYPEPKIKMCSLIHQKITTSLRNLYLSNQSNLPISGEDLSDAHIYATVYNAVCK